MVLYFYNLTECTEDISKFFVISGMHGIVQSLDIEFFQILYRYYILPGLAQQTANRAMEEVFPMPGLAASVKSNIVC